MSYKHEFEVVREDSSEMEELQECKLCSMQISYTWSQAGVISRIPCPERIVQEVVRRLQPKEGTIEFSPLMSEKLEESLTRLLRAELQNANIIPAKRKDRP